MLAVPVRLRCVVAGAALLLLYAAWPASAAVQLPSGEKLETVDFERHVMGLFGRMGCNGGSCHGSFQGKGGFRLSLFGYEPELDYWNLTRQHLGRRLDTVNPDNSLLLLKATGQLEHGGGVRFAKDSWQYQTLRQWIVDGARWTKGSGAVVKVTATPGEVAFGKPGETRQLAVKAKFAQGDEVDITPFCDFRTNDDAVADVSGIGKVRSVKAGSTAIIVTYRGNVVPVRVLVPMDVPAGFKYPAVPEVNYIDREVFARLKLLNMVPSDLAPDHEFLRRIYIDTIGSLPTPEEVRAFMNDKAADKRAKLIEKLLAHPLHAALWATKFSDITGNDTQALEQPVPLKAKRSQMWHDWFRKRVADNVPYDQIVHDVLCATSREGMTPEDWLKQTNTIDDAIAKGFDTDYANRKTLDLYWRRQANVPVEQWGEKTAAAFMGIRLECAQCHKHPFDRWSQVEYRAYANVFSQVAFGTSPDTKALVDAENANRKKDAPKANQTAVVKEVFIGPAPKNRILKHPDTGADLKPRLLGGPEIKLEAGKDMRVTLFEWLRQPDNPFFARSFVNRVWGHYFGIGIVHPVDDFSLANPASNDKLLDALAKDFIDSGYDIRALERKILLSRTYQLTSKTNATNKLDKINYAHSYVRPMMAEVMVDVLNAGLGVTENWNQNNAKGAAALEVKPGCKAIEVGASQLVQNPAIAYAFRIFGRPPRTAACDCERAAEPALSQTLYFMTDQQLLNKLKEPTGRLAGLLKTKMTNDEILDELFLATLSRLPTDNDRKVFEAGLKRVGGNRTAAFTDATWALINTREFRLQH
jgi:hypothetical protein